MIRTLILAACLALLPACQCLKPAHRNDAACAIIHQTVDCTEDVVTALGPQFIPIIKQLIARATDSTGKIDWSQIEKAMGTLGVKDGGCLLAQIQADYFNASHQLSAGPVQMTEAITYKEGFSLYRARRWPHVKFKIRMADGTTVVM